MSEASAEGDSGQANLEIHPQRKEASFYPSIDNLGHRTETAPAPNLPGEPSGSRYPDQTHREAEGLGQEVEEEETTQEASDHTSAMFHARPASLIEILTWFHCMS